MAGETEVLGENLPRRHFVHHKSHLTRTGIEPGPPRWLWRGPIRSLRKRHAVVTRDSTDMCAGHMVSTIQEVLLIKCIIQNTPQL
jgi:hypothetical protein